MAADPRRTCCPGDCLPEARIWYATLLIRIRALRAARRTLAGISFPVDSAHAEELRAAFLLCEAEVELASGDLDAAAVAAEAGLHLARRAENHELTPNGNVVMAVVATRRMDAVAGLRYANHIRDYALTGHGNMMPGQSTWAVLQALEARDGAKSVAHLVKAVVDDDLLARELLVSQPAAAAWLVRIARKLGDEKVAEQAVDRMDLLARNNRTFRSVQVAFTHASALLQRDVDALEKTAGMHVDSWSQASALEDACEVQLWRSGRTERLKRAADIYRSVGASRDETRIRTKLQELDGVDGFLSNTVGRRTKVGVGRLTDTEFSVAELVSQGLTNRLVGQRLFMSPHTVAFHLKKIYRKLGVTSRVELARSWILLVEEPAAEPA